MLSPTELFGLNDDHLVLAQDGCLLHAQTLKDFERLRRQASTYGFDIAIASSFRSFERQLMIWNNKFNGIRPVFNQHGQKVNMTNLTDWQKVQAILVYSAMPGTSRHHWGTDLDIYDRAAVAKDYQLQLDPSEYQQGGPFHLLTLWLSDNLESFNFYRPYNRDLGGVAPELWHLSNKPVASGYASAFAKNAPKLLNMLEKVQISGFSAIEQHFDYILQRYVYSTPND